MAFSFFSLFFRRARHNRILTLFFPLLLPSSPTPPTPPAPPAPNPPNSRSYFISFISLRWLTLGCKPVQQSSLKTQRSKILKDRINRHKRISDANVDFHICHSVVIKRATIVEGAEERGNFEMRDDFHETLMPPPSPFYRRFFPPEKAASAAV